MQATDAPSGSNPLVSSILDGTAPLQLKLTAARGVLPLGRADLLRILVALSADTEDQVREAASGSLATLPAEEIDRLLADPAMAPEVLAHFGGLPDASSDRMEALISNPSSPRDCLLGLAPSLPAPLIDLFLQNETRLIESPDLLDALLINPALTRPQATRIREIRKHFLRTEPAAPPEAPPEAAPREIPEEPAAAPGEPSLEEEATGEAAAEEAEEVIEGEIEQAEPENANQKILRLNTAEKIQLAFKGNREERSILIRDASKTVQEAVLKSPKISESEVEGIAKMRTVTEEVLRMITRNRDWMKNYVVVHSLATNPKTPVGVAMNLLTRINSRDLKLIAGDKNVAEVIRRQARKVQDTRNQRPGRR